MSQEQKLYVDQYEYVRGMNVISEGMQVLTYAFLKLGVIKDLFSQYDDDEYSKQVRENNFTQRYGTFS